MKWRDPRLWLGVLSLAIVLTLFALDTERVTPGPLTTTHASELALAGSSGCDECHGERRGDMATACATCHVEIGVQLAKRSGFHGQLPSVERCERCHREHHGDAVELVDERAFALAGVADRAQFKHAHVEFGLTGVHATLDCKACHPNADAARIGNGEKRFLGASQQCTSCHDDPHHGRFVRGCETCHGQEHPFEELANFTHTGAFPLTGSHARAGCAQCHPSDSQYSVEALGSLATAPVPRACIDCHASPHSAPFERGIAALLGQDFGRGCDECHASSGESFALGATMARELHAATGLALDAPHAAATCAQCHGDRDGHATFAQRFERGRDADDCAACHADPHGDQFESSEAKLSCLDCHAREHFAPMTFDVAAHARTAFPLDGAHAMAACNDCHFQSPGEPRVFRGTPSKCEQCHTDAHSGSFANLLEQRGLPLDDKRGSCAACHSTGSFADTSFTPALHGASTRFALNGAHARADCETCHTRSAKPDAAGRRFGRVAEVFGGPVSSCATCHRDVHEGAFDRHHLPTSVQGRSSCARCHSEERFRELAAPFDHGAWTNFVLDGAHALADCASCHGTMDDERVAGRRLGRVADVHSGPPDRCVTCHSDPHDGAFERVEPGVDCSRCHSTLAFAGVASAAFEHARWTGFELAGAHATAACEACHVPAREHNGVDHRFGRAAGRACVECHVDPHAGQFTRAGATDCARCHSSSGAFELIGFDHARDTRFALDAKHSKHACSACHVPWATASGAKVVRYKPLGTSCADCHGFAGRGTER